MLHRPTTMLRCALTIAVLQAACGGDSGGSDSPNSPDAGTPTFSVLFETTKGAVVIDVQRDWSPNGADRFRELVDSQFYDNCRFFRVIPGFVVQFGINGTPTTQAMWDGNTINDDPVVISNLRGTITFAKTSEPNSRTTQLFINYVDNTFLDEQGFSPFAVVRTGMENLDMINAEHGERPDQERTTAQGNSYLDANFPGLDSINTARVQ